MEALEEDAADPQLGQSTPTVAAAAAAAVATSPWLQQQRHPHQISQHSSTTTRRAKRHATEHLPRQDEGEQEPKDGYSVAAPSVASSDSSSGVVFRLRVVELDHYLSPPLSGLDASVSLFSRQRVVQTPVLRVWGRTPAGQAGCAHIHGVFPYLYVNLSAEAWDTALKLAHQERVKLRDTMGRAAPPTTPPDGGGDGSGPSALNVFLSRFGACVERALKELQQLDSTNRRAAQTSEAQMDEAGNRAGEASAAEAAPPWQQGKRPNKPYIHSMCVVRARSIYGFAPTEKPYIKMSFYEPGQLRRVGSILQSGCILGVSFEVYESHIPFHLQFMADANVAGMDFLDLGPGVNFRQPLPVTAPVPGARHTAQVTPCNSDNPDHLRKSFSSSRLNVAYEAEEPQLGGVGLGAAPWELEVHQGASRVWTTSSTPSHLLASIRRTKLTRCALEVDCGIESVMNAGRILREPLEQTSAEAQLVQSLAGLWSGERDRRRALKRTQRRHARAKEIEGGTEASLSASSASHDIEFTPLTPKPSPDRVPLPPSNLDIAYSAHIERVTAREKRFLERKNGVESPSQLPSPLPHRQSQRPPGSDSAPLDDLDALMREAEDSDSDASDKGDDASGIKRDSLLAAAIRDARTALSQIGGSHSQHPHASSSRAEVPIDLDELPSAFAMSQMPMPQMSEPEPSHEPSQTPGFAQPVSFFFSQMPEASFASQLPYPAASGSPFPHSQRHTPQILELAALAYVSRLPADDECDEDELAADAPPSQSQSQCAAWLDGDKLLLTQMQHEREESEHQAPDEEPLELKLPSDDDPEEEDTDAAAEQERADVLRHSEVDETMTTSLGLIPEIKENELESKYDEEKRPDVDPREVIVPMSIQPPAVTPAVVLSNEPAPLEEDSPRLVVDTTEQHQQLSPITTLIASVESASSLSLSTALPAPSSVLVTSPVAVAPVLVEDSITPTLVAVVPSSPSTILVPPSLTAASIARVPLPLPMPNSPNSRSPSTSSFTSPPPSSSRTTALPPAAVVPISLISPSAGPNSARSKSSPSLISPPAAPLPNSSSSLHFERIMESRVLRVGAVDHLQYKMQLCYADGTLMPGSSGGIKWFSAPRVQRRPDLLQAWYQRLKQPPPQLRAPRPAAPAASSPSSSSVTAPTPLSPADLVLQARARHRQPRAIVDLTELRSPPSVSRVASAMSQVRPPVHSASKRSPGGRTLYKPRVRPPVPIVAFPPTTREPPRTPVAVASAARAMTAPVTSAAPREIVDLAHEDFTIPPSPNLDVEDDMVIGPSDEEASVCSASSSARSTPHAAHTRTPSADVIMTEHAMQPIAEASEPMQEDDHHLDTASLAAMTSQPPHSLPPLHHIASPLKTQHARPVLSVVPLPLPVFEPSLSEDVLASAPSSPELVLSSSGASSPASVVVRPRHPIFALSRDLDPVPTAEDRPKELTPSPALTFASLSLPLTTQSSAPEASFKPPIDHISEPAAASVAVQVGSAARPVPREPRRFDPHAHDRATWDPSQPLRFERCPLPSSTVLHVLRTAPPTAEELLASCSAHGIWPIAPLRPFFSKREHWRHHVSQVTPHGVSVQAYAAAALGSMGQTVSLTIGPPPDLVEAMPPALPTVKTAVPLALRPTFEEFHHPVFHPPAAPGACESVPLFIPSVAPPSVHTSLGHARVLMFAACPPTLQQLAAVSKNWTRDIKRLVAKEAASTSRREKRRQANAIHVEPAAQSSVAAKEAAACSSDSEAESDTEIPTESQMPRPASPKHDESCLLSYSYFQPPGTVASASNKPRLTGTQRRGEVTPHTQRSRARTSFASPMSRLGPMTLKTPLASRLLGAALGGSPMLGQASLTPKPAVTTTPAKAARLSVAATSPHQTAASTSASASASGSAALNLATTAASRGSHTQRKQAESQIEGPTPAAATPMRFNTSPADESRIDASSQQHLTCLSLEVHACTRGALQADPRHDAVAAIIYTVRHQLHGEHEHRPDLKGVLLCTHLQDSPPHPHPGAAGSVPTSPRACPACSPSCPLPLLGLDSSVLVQSFPCETSLIHGFIALVHRTDPDVLLGWEMQKGALGYLAERAHHLGRSPLQQELSRILPPKLNNANKGPSLADGFRGAERDRSNPAAAYAWAHSSGLTVSGRIVLNLWRIMRDELKLCSYTFENVAAHLLGRRFPSYPPFVLTRWFQSTIYALGGRCGRENQPAPHAASGMHRVIMHYLDKCVAVLEIVDRLDLIGRTAELARVFGISFYSVLDRGTQYRVESMLLRLSKPQNYLLLSISPVQRSQQPAMECIPLIMEPVSAFYTDPVVVLDFQSLYPSMIIANNICFSTCLGRVPNAAVDNQHARPTRAEAPLNASPPMSQSQSQYSDASQQSQRAVDPQPVAAAAGGPAAELMSPARSIGASLASPSTAGLAATPLSQHHLGGGMITRTCALLSSLHSSGALWVSSNGVMFARPAARQGILPRMLREILATRVMVKTAMKRPEVVSHRGLHRLLNARQFGLKLISNVTYGYTAAGFSGRMPCAEIADAIVQSGRDTLERAIRLVEADENWKAKVVYGDTDSLFVLLPGRSKVEAFRIGHEIAARVTAANPKPVRLQMDKVYQPCLLMSKKRYVGFKYESPAQTTPTLEAKGIETVRRDGCPAVVKTMESVLRLLFETHDLSAVRSYLERQWSKVWMGRVSMGDFVFSKEVRLGNYRQPPLGAVLAERIKAQDSRAAALHAERVPYVIVDGPPHARLVDRLQHPLALLLRPDLHRLCASYYIEVAINRPLARVLDLLGVDLNTWFAAWHRPKRQALAPTPVIERPLPPAAGGVRVRQGIGFAHAPSSRRTIDQYYASQQCAWCGLVTRRGAFCDACRALPVVDTTVGASELLRASRGAAIRHEFTKRLQAAQAASALALDVCASCMDSASVRGSCRSSPDSSLVSARLSLGSREALSLCSSAVHRAAPCTSLDCPNQFARTRKHAQAEAIQRLVDDIQ